MRLRLEPPPVKVDLSHDLTVVHFTGCKVLLDEEMLHRIHDSLIALAYEPSESHLLLDFGNVEYLSSLALAALVDLHKKLLAKGRQLTIGNLTPQVREVFAVTMLDQFLDLRLTGDDEQSTVEECQPRSPTGVLVVDDDEGVRSILAELLRIEGCKVWAADNGLQAIDVYDRHREGIALILLDVLMPGLDGPRTLSALQKVCPTVCCCFMTGISTSYTEEGLSQLGAIRVLQKPFEITEVIDTLNELAIRSPRRRQERWIETHLKGA